MSLLTNLDINKRRRLYISGGVESPFGQSATLTHCFLSLLDGEPLQPTAIMLNDQEFSSAGIATDFPTRHLVKGYDFPGTPVPVIATNEGILMTFLKTLGHDTKTSLGGSLYSHQGPGAATDADLPGYPAGFTAEEHMGGVAAVADSDYKFLGMQSARVELSWGETDLAVLTIQIMGSGKTDVASLASEAAIVVPMTFVTPVQIRSWIQAAAGMGQTSFGGHAVSATAWQFPTLDVGATDLNAHMKGGKITLDVGLGVSQRQGQEIGSGLYMAQRKQGTRKASAELQLRIDDVTRPLLKKFSGSSWSTQNEYTVGFDIIGQTNGHGVQIVLPLTDPPIVSGGAGAGEAVRTFLFNARKVTAGTAYGPISIYGVNADDIDYATMA